MIGTSSGMIDLNDALIDVSRYDLPALKQALCDTAYLWMPPLFPMARRSLNGAELRMADPSGRPPRHEGSCVARLRGPHAGSIYDHDGGLYLGPLDVIEQQTGYSGRELLDHAASLVGAVPLKPAAPAQGDQARQEHTQREIQFILAGATPAAGTLVEAYFRARGLVLPASPDLFFHPDLADQGGTNRGWPGMVAIVRAADGTATGGIHRTYLAEDGAGRAAIDRSKRMLGPVKGGGVWLGDPAATEIAVGEGIETTASGMAIFGAERGCAALSAGALAEWQWPSGTTAVLILADAGDAGEKAAAQLAERLTAAGIPHRIARPLDGDDFNDDLRHSRTAQDYAPPPAALDARSMAAALTRASDPKEVGATLLQALRERLDPLELEALVKFVKQQSGMPLTSLRSMLRMLARAGTETSPAIAQMCERYVFVKSVNRLWDRQTREFYELNAVRNAHWAEMPLDDVGERVSPLNVLLVDKDGCEKVDSVTFVPDGDEIVHDDGARLLNRWAPSGVGMMPGDASPFVDHVRFVLDGDEAAANHVLDYLAHLIQFPHLKVRSTVLIISKAKGLGKSMIAEMVGEILGRRSSGPISNEELKSAFNEWIDGAQFIWVNELMSMGRLDTMNKLKEYITTDILRINRKGISTYSYQSCVNFMLFSNHEDAASIEDGDRRYFVWSSKAIRRPQAYYAGLWGWFKAGGREILHHYLKHRPLEGFDRHAPAPMTEAKERIIRESVPDWVAFLAEAHTDIAKPLQHDLVNVLDLCTWLADKTRFHVTPHKIGRWLESIGAVRLEEQIMVDGVRRRIWAIRDLEHWTSVYARPGVEYRKISEA